MALSFRRLLEQGQVAPRLMPTVLLVMVPRKKAAVLFWLEWSVLFCFFKKKKKEREKKRKPLIKQVKQVLFLTSLICPYFLFDQVLWG